MSTVKRVYYGFYLASVKPQDLIASNNQILINEIFLFCQPPASKIQQIQVS